MSRALLAGESIDEIAFLLGHRDATVTRAVYLRELSDARRRATRRDRMAAQYESALKAAARDPRPDPTRCELGAARDVRRGD